MSALTDILAKYPTPEAAAAPHVEKADDCLQAVIKALPQGWPKRPPVLRLTPMMAAAKQSSLGPKAKRELRALVGPGLPVSEYTLAIPAVSALILSDWATASQCLSGDVTYQFSWLFHYISAARIAAREAAQQAREGLLKSDIGPHTDISISDDTLAALPTWAYQAVRAEEERLFLARERWVNEALVAEGYLTKNGTPNAPSLDNMIKLGCYHNWRAIAWNLAKQPSDRE